jgi:hypothetical protein
VPRRLDAAEKVDLIRPSQLHGRDRGGRDLTADRRRAGSHPLDTGDLGRDDSHVGRRGQGVAASRHIRTSGTDWQVLLPEKQAQELPSGGPHTTGAGHEATLSDTTDPAVN